MTIQQREQALAQVQWEMEESYGLHKPFILRTLELFTHSILLDLGKARNVFDIVGEQEVRALILNTLPYTLILTGSANILVFVASVALALNICRKYGSLIGRLLIAFSPLSSAPSW